MFQVGRVSIPKPAPRNLEDLDSVQRVLLHRSVWPGAREGPPLVLPGFRRGRDSFSCWSLAEASDLGVLCAAFAAGRGAVVLQPLPESCPGDPPSPLQRRQPRVGGIIHLLQKTLLDREGKEHLNKAVFETPLAFLQEHI